LTEKEKISFELLKQKVASTFLQDNSALSPDISQWKGDDIIKFQEDLLQKVKARVSEKWFYNYFRNDIQKLPRIDMLNLLSEYAGYSDWANFLQQNSKTLKNRSWKNPKTSGIYVFFTSLIALTLILGFVLSRTTDKNIKLCFVDENLNPIEETVKIFVKMNQETERVLHTDKNNCVEFHTKQHQINLRIISPYYKEKTINRNIELNEYQEEIILETDFYSLMLRYFSNTQTKDWQKRRDKLRMLIDDEAVIYQQWFGKNKGVEIYSKDDFIYQLTVPTSILRNIEILEIERKNNKIFKLRFKVNP